jgi:patatin-like phospholipase/acyl hydrolase
MAKCIKVLSIDGGGIRGLIPAIWLSKIEEKTGCKISNLFDYIAGTSTGGILSLLLTLLNKDNTTKYTAKNVIQLFENKGKEIFPSLSYQTISSLGGLTDEKYPSSGIEKILKSYLGFETKFKTAKKKVLITAYDIEKAFPVMFKNWHEHYENLFTWEIARATSAAPTYFEPYKISSWPNSTLVDGGLFANNPTMCVFSEALKENPNSEIVVISMGTGILRRNLSYNESKDYGLPSWARVLLNVMMNGNNQAVDYQMKQVLRKNETYFRLQVPLHMGNDDMDDASYTNMSALKSLADVFLGEKPALFNNICKRLME